MGLRRDGPRTDAAVRAKSTTRKNFWLIFEK